MSWYQWQQAENRRHALDVSREVAVPDTPFTALCGATVTPTRADFPTHGGIWLAPTCWGCDHQIRVRSGFPTDQIPPLPAEQR